MIFEHTAREKGMWRGWLRNGQSLEITWPSAGVGLRLLIHSNDADRGDRMLNVALGFGQAFIPLGITPGPYEVGEEPSWGFELSREFGIVFHWGQRRKSFNWPFRRIVLAWEFETTDGEWRPVMNSFFGRRAQAKAETCTYVYVLRSGSVQQRQATIFRERWTRSRHILHRLGWPKEVSYSIDVKFDGEVGERTGSWKGGTIGCGYDMAPGEAPIDTLRRMERERRFR